ncbi:MAG TPA: DNA alkylation repair protein [Prolixibacteraceae bacterium]|nr:DNA alkylation repair protein [Prolixibacteraceae bacterium]
MDIWLDNKEAEQRFREMLTEITSFRNGEAVSAMQRYGIQYKVNMGVSLTDLKTIAGRYVPSHVVALKLWNRNWRETMILATLLDEPGQVTEEQMDFWTKSSENSEIAEQLSANLWWRTPFAYVKALEWCRGKKHWVRYTSIHLAGRLAMMDKASPDEIFDPFFDEFITLAKDPSLSNVLYRSLLHFANRSLNMKQMVTDWSIILREGGTETAVFLAEELEKGLAG